MPCEGWLVYFQLGTPMQSASLWKQPASFWVGSFLVAEAPAALLLSMLPEERRDSLLDFAFFSALLQIVGGDKLIIPFC